jgi:MSHA pilin protein MshC
MTHERRNPITNDAIKPMSRYRMPSRSHAPLPCRRGFTLVEMVGILIIVAIISVVALPRFFDRQMYDARAYSDQMQSMLRYAQKLAIAQHRPVYVILSGGSSSRVALCFDQACSAGNLVAPSAGTNSGSSATLAACGSNRNWACEAAPSGVAFSSAPSIGAFYFSNSGKPYGVDNSDLPNLQISIADAEGGRILNVERETGYVYHP